MFNSSELLFAIVHRTVGWDLRQPLKPAKKHLITTLRDEIRQPDQQPLRLTIPREERLARVADALLDDVADDRTLDAWADVAGMARRTFMRAFSAQAGMSKCHYLLGSSRKFFGQKRGGFGRSSSGLNLKKMLNFRKIKT
jgi:transcriptional regulator GlxA family with amidase domain